MALFGDVLLVDKLEQLLRFPVLLVAHQSVVLVLLAPLEGHLENDHVVLVELFIINFQHLLLLGADLSLQLEEAVNLELQVSVDDHRDEN